MRHARPPRPTYLLAAEGVHTCVQGDVYTCSEWDLAYSAPNAWEQCSSACNSTLDAKFDSVRDSENDTAGEWYDYMDFTASDKSWYVVCGWQGITKLDKMCNKTFTPELPLAASNNFGVTLNETSQQELYFNGTVDWDECNVHAFCYTCTEDDGSLNKYCEAVLQKYSYHGYKTPSNIRDLVYDDMVR